jgi:hypothetical protein
MTMSSAPSRRIDQSAQIVGWRAAQARQAAQQRNRRDRRRGQGAPITATMLPVVEPIAPVMEGAKELNRSVQKSTRTLQKSYRKLAKGLRHQDRMIAAITTPASAVAVWGRGAAQPPRAFGPAGPTGG